MKPVLTCLIIAMICAGTVNAQELSHKIHLTTEDTQCLSGNEFCFTDTITPKPGVPLKKAIYLFSDGSMRVFNPLLNPYVFLCNSFDDPSGGSYSVTIEIHDSDDNVIKKTYSNLFTVRDCISSVNNIHSNNDISLQYDLANHTASLAYEDKLQIEIYDIQGRNISLKYEISAGKIVIDLNELPKGIFTLLIHRNGDNTYIPVKLINP